MIYLDNAATTLHKPPQVIAAVAEAMSSMGNASRGAHDGAMSAARAIYRARTKLAELFGCPRADRVAFACNATEALNIAIHGLIPENGRVVSTDWEHNSVLRPLYRMERERSAELGFVPADGRGRLDYGAFEELIGQGADAVICTHASNLTGDMVDIARVSRLAHRAGAILAVDASQTAGAFPLNMTELGIDVLCFTGHKGLMGPQGTGGLCVRPGRELRPWKVGGTGVRSFSQEQPEDMPTRLEAGTLNTHGIAGLSAAVDFIQVTGVETIRAKEDRLARRFYRGISSFPNVRVYGDFTAPYRAPIVSLNIGDEDSGTISDLLFQRYDIATRPGAHCAPRLHRALGTEEQGAVRFSFSWFNTEDEVDAAVQAVGELAE